MMENQVPITEEDLHLYKAQNTEESLSKRIFRG